MKRYFFILIFSLLQLIAGSGNKLSAQEVTPSCACSCLKPLFDYLVSSRRLFIKETDHILVSSLVNDANRAGYNVSFNGCPILTKNINKYFYSLTTSEVGSSYKAMIGDCSIVLSSTGGTSISFYNLVGKDCDNSGNVLLTYNAPIHKRYWITRSVNAFLYLGPNDVYPAIPGQGSYFGVDSTSSSIFAAYTCANGSNLDGFQAQTLFAADSLVNLPDSANVLSAYLYLFAKPEGFHPPAYPNAHTTLAETRNRETASLSLTASKWKYSDPPSLLEGFGGLGNGYRFVGMDGHFEDWIYDLSTIIKTNGNRIMDEGFNLTYSLEVDSVLRYVTFCSEKYADVSKRPYIDITYTLKGDSSTIAQLKIDSCFTCSDATSSICYSAVTDTSVNPYTFGITGNWRAYRSYAYYGDRSETDPSLHTNIRKDGTIRDFSGFWKLAGDKWLPQNTDTARWVWNSEITLHNRRGIELENKDPLGRYNAGLFGYDEALPVAVIQNARYRESAFEGFEDYNFGIDTCDAACASARNFDFSAYKSNLDTTEQHTGKYSLRIAGNASAGISTNIVPDTGNVFGLSFNTADNNCPTTSGTVLKRIQAGRNVLLPTFSPLAGKKIVVSAWVKEAQVCKGETYTGNQISIVIGRVAGNITVIAKPQGGIIEGWQRYEQVIDLPADVTMLSVNMQATTTTAVFFDDLRIHPYNANMKSFVYNPENLRLMAELDENNYATMYEYDDDGTLIRLKKETERGIKTITETRSALLKE